MSVESNIADLPNVILAFQEIKKIAEECIRAIKERSEVRPSRKQIGGSKHVRVNHTLNAAHLSFNTNRLAFMKKYAQGLSGHQKFTLLLSHLAKGSISQQVASAEVEKHWNKMKLILGGKYYAAYAIRAKAEGWVDTPKHGLYTLSTLWKDALTKEHD